MRCMSWGCVGMYMFITSIGVKGLLLMIMACRYGEIVLGVGIFWMFSLVYIDLGNMVSMPPLAKVGPEYLFCLCVTLFELLYMIL